MGKPNTPPLNNVDKIRLLKWLMKNAASLNGWTIAAISERARKELNIRCVDSTIRRTIDDGELGIKYVKGVHGNTGMNPMRQLYLRMGRLEQAYLNLCKQIDATPEYMGPITEEQATDE